MKPDFVRAQAYALTRLQNELPSELTYHSLWHTQHDVVPAVEQLAKLEHITGEALLLLRTAAWYHDIGFVRQPNDHELIGIEIAQEVLPSFGYCESHIHIITNIILATKLPQSPHTLLEQLMADADLDSLGRSDFLCRSLDLHTELALFGTVIRPTEWYYRQLQFLRQHSYFTHAAHSVRDLGKQSNIAMLRTLVAAIIPGGQRSGTS